MQIVIPLLLSLLLPIALYAVDRRPHLQLWIGVGCATLKFLLLARLYDAVLRDELIEVTLLEILPGIPLALRVDAFGLIFALVATFLWILATFYSFGYLTSLGEKKLTRFFSFFSWAIFATVGAALSANLFTFYVFYELLSLSTWPLVVHHQTDEAKQAGRRYLFFILGSSIALLLPAMVIAYSAGTSVDFASPSLSPDLLTGWTGVLFLLMFLFGFAKAALMPFHSWLPNAMVAPTPVSSLLHAVAVVKVGVFGIMRVVTGVFGVDLLHVTVWDYFSASDLIVFLAASTMLLSAVLAYSQKTLKGLLAYSTIGQLAYIVLALGLLSSEALVAASSHIAFHAFGKITLFFCAGAIYVATGFKKLDQLSGIGKTMPLTMAAFLIGSATVIGLPPTSGFVSKWYFVQGCISSGQYAILVCLFLNTLLKIGYFAPVIFRAYFSEPNEAAMQYRRGSSYCIFPPVLTAGLSLLLLFDWIPVVSLAKLGVSRLF